MLPKPHGGELINRFLTGKERQEALQEAPKLPRLDVDPELASDILNIASGVFSPLEGFLSKEDFFEVLYHKRLADGLPWTIPIVLDVTDSEAAQLSREEPVALYHNSRPLALLDAPHVYSFNPLELAQQVFGTADPKHPGVAKALAMKPLLIGGKLNVLNDIETPFAKYSLKPLETRVLFEERGWRTVVGFQTRNVPHLGHEYVQKTALTFVDGIFINPLIGQKKKGDFKDEVIIRSYEALMRDYYLKERAVMAVLHTNMRYAGPREAVYHAIIRKNFGCTHFIVGRDHAGVGSFYAPYAAQEIFEEFPDLGIVPLFFTAFFYCKKCGGVANEKTCPHGEEKRSQFSGTLLRDALLGKAPKEALERLIRPEVAQIIRRFENPFVDEEATC